MPGKETTMTEIYGNIYEERDIAIAEADRLRIRAETAEAEVARLREKLDDALNRLSIIHKGLVKLRDFDRWE